MRENRESLEYRKREKERQSWKWRKDRAQEEGDRLLRILNWSVVSETPAEVTLLYKTTQ